MSERSPLSSTIAKHLLEIEAVALRPSQPFTWTSGLKSPIYCDNRLTMAYPEVRNQIADGFASLIHEHCPDTDVIAGTATAGIPHAAWTAGRLDLPMVYVRDKAKGHGKENLIEGVLKPGQKVVVIEDLISTGGSSLKAAQAVNEAGGHVLAVLAIFTYEFPKAERAFAEGGFPLHVLSNYSALIDIALELGKIAPEDMDALRSWRSNPEAFGQAGKSS